MNVIIMPKLVPFHMKLVYFFKKNEVTLFRFPHQPCNSMGKRIRQAYSFVVRSTGNMCKS